MSVYPDDFSSLRAQDCRWGRRAAGPEVGAEDICSDCLLRQVATRMASIRGGRGYAVPKAVPKAFEFESFFEVFSPGSSREALEGSEDPRGAHLLLQLPAGFP